MNTKSRVLTLSLGVAVIATAFLGSNAVAGAKGPDGAYGQPASNRVVVGTVRGNQGHRGNRARGGNRHRHGHGRNGVVVVQPQLNAPRNYYFEQRTGQGIAGAPAMPSVYFNSKTNRGAKRHHRDASRVVGNRAHSRRGLTEQEVRSLIDQLPPRTRNTVVDPRSQAAERESSGISFGPRSTSTAAALAARQRAPSAAATEGYGQRAPRVESDLPSFDTGKYGSGKHGSDQYIYAQGTWYVPHNGRLRPALPPTGLSVNALPNGFESVSRGGREYFTHDGVYMRRYGNGYVVVDTPAGSTGDGNGNDATPSLD